MSNWPATLPQDLLAGASITDDESRLTSQMDAGPASVRNRFTAVTKTVKGDLMLTGAELAEFNTFLRTTLQHGALSFTWTDPSSGASVSMRFRKKPEWNCIRTASNVNERLWRGSFELEILP